MSNPPVEIPLGAMRFNSDSQKLEYWNGSAWFQIRTFTPNYDGGGRALFGGGVHANTYLNIIDFVTISTHGDAVDFGDLSYLQYAARSFSSSTRGLWYGGYPGGTSVNTIEFITISTTGNSTDFGDATSRNNSGAGIANATRGLAATGYYGPAISNNIDMVTIASTGNATDFGDTFSARTNCSGCGSPTRGIVAGGNPGNPSPANNSNTIEFITISTLGNGQDFGDLLQVRADGPFGGSNSTRAFLAGGVFPSPESQIFTMDKIEIATTGNAIDFGDLKNNSQHGNGTASSLRFVSMGGASPSSPYSIQEVQYANFATGGTAVALGDLTANGRWSGDAACSNAHGGLG